MGHRFGTLLLLVSACAAPKPAPPPDPGPPAPSAAPTGTAAVPADAGVDASTGATPGLHAPLVWVEDDVPAARARAKGDGKVVFVDTWAEWCHTCLSVKHFVLTDPSLRPLGDSVVFVSVDTENEKNAAFVDHYAIDVWPTFFVLDPDGGDVLGYWPGAASVREMDGFVREAIEARDARHAATLDAKSPLAALLAAKAEQARSSYDDARKQYAEAVARAPKNWPRRSEALVGWLGALFNAGHADECVRVGLLHLDSVEGAARPTDFTRTLLECSEHVSDAQLKQKAQKAALARLRQIAAAPHPESTPDDRADTLDALSDVLVDLGDKKAAREAQQTRLALLEEAAAAAPSPSAAATYDYMRANSYVALGRAAEAVKMLSEREKQLPDSYEPPARLAGVLARLKKYPDALQAIDRALAHATGPRRLSYLSLKANIQGALGDYAGRVKTLEEEVRGYEEHAKRQSAKPQRLETAKKRLDAAKRALSAAKSRPR
jgi:tetratricopeptide (TPR) repeat protein